MLHDMTFIHSWYVGQLHVNPLDTYSKIFEIPFQWKKTILSLNLMFFNFWIETKSLQNDFIGIKQYILQLIKILLSKRKKSCFPNKLYSLWNKINFMTLKQFLNKFCFHSNLSNDVYVCWMILLRKINVSISLLETIFFIAILLTYLRFSFITKQIWGLVINKSS